MFNNEDCLKFRIFCQSIIVSPRPIDAQYHKREGIFIWCEDWEIIELCKYLFHGRELYYGDPPPNRLKFNPLWSKDDIAEKAEKLIAEFKDADSIIEHLRKRRTNGSA